MTEREWLASTDWQVLWGWVRSQMTDRQHRLFAVAVCRRIAPGLLRAASVRALLLAEKWADGEASSEEIDTTRRRLDAVLAEAVHRSSWKPPEYAVSAPLCCLELSAPNAVRYAVPTAWRTSQPPRDRVWAGDTVARLRDIFGNPFQPGVFDPSWRTETAVSLAKRMYKVRDFSLMPILADALQDAGCENADVLAHCRDPQGVHVRGCWVVDLVLGKA